MIDAELRAKIKDLESSIVDAEDHLARCRNELNAGKELPKTGSKWRNVKTGNIYTVESNGFHTENMECLIAYGKDGKTFYRPATIWYEKFEPHDMR